MCIYSKGFSACIHNALLICLNIHCIICLCWPFYKLKIIIGWHFYDQFCGVVQKENIKCCPENILFKVIYLFSIVDWVGCLFNIVPMFDFQRWGKNAIGKR